MTQREEIKTKEVTKKSNQLNEGGLKEKPRMRGEAQFPKQKKERADPFPSEAKESPGSTTAVPRGAKKGRLPAGQNQCPLPNNTGRKIQAK